nr:type I-E CRISPR-associated endoribonuclease Cas2e [Vaginimicrobium propionicum]
MVLVLTTCPAGLRGHLTRWLLEIAPGVYVGRPSARVRDALWERTMEMVSGGQAIMVENAMNEQGLRFRVHEHSWEPVDMDGVQLVRRPKKPSGKSRLKPGWSTASKMRMAKRRKRSS